MVAAICSTSSTSPADVRHQTLEPCWAMTVSRRGKLGLRDLRSVQPGQKVWDGSVSGFGARRQDGGVISYIVVYRTREGRQRTYTIGKHGSPWSPDSARQEARRVLGEVVKGADPLADKIAGRKAITVTELCGQYLADVEAGRLLTRRKIAKTESTLISDRGRIARHIIPLLGRMPVKTVRRGDIERFMHDVAAGKTATREKTKPRGLSIVRGGRGVAGRTVALLGAIFSYAVRQGIRLDNPVHGVVKFAEGRRQRRLSNDEYRMLGMALSKARQEKVWKPAIAATWLMILTGWRRGEVLGLRWSGDRSAATNCTTGRYQDRRIAAAVVGTGLRRDPVPAEDRRCGVRQFIGRHADRRLSQDVAEDRQAGWIFQPISRLMCCATASPVSRPISATTSRPSRACSATRRTRSPAGTCIPPMPCCWQQPMPWPMPP